MNIGYQKSIGSSVPRLLVGGPSGFFTLSFGCGLSGLVDQAPLGMAPIQLTRKHSHTLDGRACPKRIKA